MDSFNWENFKSELERIFFKDFSFFGRGSPELAEFWSFFKHYRKFQARRSTPVAKKEDPAGGSVSEKLGLPRAYDKSYRIPMSVVTPDLLYKLRREHERREDGGREASTLSMEHLSEFRIVLRHFINFKQKQKFEKLVKVCRDQANLPIAHYASHILSAVHAHQVVLVAGDTGCGKSTQVPQYLLNAGFGKIACTQPRRIACISLAKRVGYETLKEHGTEIAYQVRFEASKSPATKILFLTEGLLLRQLQTDPHLSWYDVLIVDEVHERHIHGDFLLGILRNLIEQRQDLKLILMSATINIQLFSGYFDNAPVIKVPGRLYPIEMQFFPIPTTGFGPQDKIRKSGRLDPKPYMKIIQKIDDKYPPSERGDMLVFLSGMNEIASLMDEVKVYAQQTHRWIALALHSALSIEEQDKVFDVAPDGVRKCIISTNIAETSITIDGIRFVVDSGKVKEMSYDSQAKMRRLQEFWISRASAEQRKGRAGRTGPGVCYRMYSESDYDAFNEYSTPEIMRVPLDSLVLQLAALGINNVRKFPFIEPPSLSNIETAIAFLKEQGALHSDETLTPIGRMLAQLPVDIIVGKMLIMGTLFHVIEPVLTLAAALSIQSPFNRVPLGHNDITVARRPLESEHGDPFTLLNAFEEWVELKGGSGGNSSHQWCRRRGLEQQRFYEMAKLRQQFQEILKEHGLLGRGGGGDVGRGKRRGGPLTEGQLTDLRQARKKHRTENRTRKLLRMDEEGGAMSDEEDVRSGTSELRDLEFKLFHNLADLQEASALRQNFSLRDLNVLKLVVCSGLYPQLAISDDCNSYRKDLDQVFHTKSKQFVVLHPMSVFATNPDHIDPAQRKSKGNMQPELLAYVDLLETNKPYLVSCMRTPALQTLTLFSQNIDTNTDCTRLVVDEWLELKFLDAASGQQVVSCIQTLRNTWASMLETKLEASMNRSESERDHRLDKKVIALEDLLASKLAEFLDSSYSYSLRQLSSAVKSHLYKSSSDTSATVPNTTSSSSDPSRLFVSADSKPHPFKGGWCIQDYLTYDCLLDEGEAAASGSEQYIRRVWSCPNCDKTLALSLAEQLQHQATCVILPKSDADDGQDPADNSAAIKRDYHCHECGETKQLSSIGILKHKRMHAQQK